GNYHNHTDASFDCRTRPKDLVTAYVAAGFREIAVTDHNDWSGSNSVAKVVEASGSPLRVLRAAEISSKVGEIICLGLVGPVETGDPERIIRKIRDQGGIVYLPHPYKRSAVCASSVLMSGIDAIEVVNGRASVEQNLLAVGLCIDHGKFP